MPLYPMSEILEDAKQKKYGVGYFNNINTEMTRSCIRAAEDLRSPVIMGTAEALLKYSSFDWVAPMLLDVARNATVPVAVHFDHGYNVDTIMKALRYGFGSVMFDGSIHSFEENIRISAEIATIAHAMGAGLECELGKVGGLEEGEGEIGVDQLTEASEVTMFLEKTNADFLAISIGTTHGVYAKTPNLDLERLAEIRSITDIPLVLHGGSGLSDLDYKNCIAGGIQKINTFTDVVNAAIETARGISEDAPYVELSKLMEDAMYDAVALKIKTYGSDGKA